MIRFTPYFCIFLCVALLACDRRELDSFETESAEAFNQGIRLTCDQSTQVQQQIDCYRTQIQQHVERLWYFPKGAREKGFRSRVKVYLAPQGFPLKLEFIESSNNHAFDTSVRRAITRASPFPLPEDRDLYADQFSDVTLVFQAR